ncbi:VanZ family protein [Viridibacillus sp. YIM B01967]|uniref:VanZ family protein n=1 Tax=Viridibacillus soli TaxID=2798301 RepID=A0ABS1H912_9BACL|nr:VanZ family protein [Viridibacillus soli]MBK3495909.1 VanZ family protein [Viridibacillus soli]
MAAYTQPIYVAMITFIFLAIVIFVPWLIYTYRKYGYLPLSTTLIIFSFVFYFITALFLVLLPLPESRNTCITQQPGTQHYSLMPFRFIADIFANSGIVLSQPATYALLVKQPAFYQAFFNFLLLLPFGVYLRYFFQQKKYWKKALGFTFALTLFYEITQVTGIYGIYNCAYRIFDVDDLMLNTVGGVLGFFIAPAILALFPSKESINAKAERLMALDDVRALPVLIALLIDVFIIDFVSQLSTAFVESNIVIIFLIKSLFCFIVFFIIPLVWNGHTIGSKIMRFRYDSKISDSDTRKRMFKRFVAIYLTYFTFFVLSVFGDMNLQIGSPYYELKVFLALGTGLLNILLIVVLFFHVLLVAFGKGKRRFYFDEASDLHTTRK